MSLEDVKAYFKQWDREEDVLVLSSSSATVELAAEALNTEPERIAKTLAFRGTGEEEALLVVTAGDAKIDNKKFRQTFGGKARMLSPEETLEHTGHAVGGVCPFGLKKICRSIWTSHSNGSRPYFRHAGAATRQLN